MHRRTGAQMQRCTDAKMHRCKDAQMHRRTDAQTHRCARTRTHARTRALSMHTSASAPLGVAPLMASLRRRRVSTRASTTLARPVALRAEISSSCKRAGVTRRFRKVRTSQDREIGGLDQSRLDSESVLGVKATRLAWTPPVPPHPCSSAAALAGSLLSATAPSSAARAAPGSRSSPEPPVETLHPRRRLLQAERPVHLRRRGSSPVP